MLQVIGYLGGRQANCYVLMRIFFFFFFFFFGVSVATAEARRPVNVLLARLCLACRLLRDAHHTVTAAHHDASCSGGTELTFWFYYYYYYYHYYYYYYYYYYYCYYYYYYYHYCCFCFCCCIGDSDDGGVEEDSGSNLVCWLAVIGTSTSPASTPWWCRPQCLAAACLCVCIQTFIQILNVLQIYYICIYITDERATYEQANISQTECII